MLISELFRSTQNFQKLAKFTIVMVYLSWVPLDAAHKRGRTCQSKGRMGSSRNSEWHGPHFRNKPKFYQKVSTYLRYLHFCSLGLFLNVSNLRQHNMMKLERYVLQQHYPKEKRLSRPRKYTSLFKGFYRQNLEQDMVMSSTGKMHFFI